MEQNTERSDFLRLTNASHEAMEKLDRYAALLVEWSEKFNLVAPSTLPHIWSRHFLDPSCPHDRQRGRGGELAELE